MRVTSPPYNFAVTSLLKRFYISARDDITADCSLNGNRRNICRGNQLFELVDQLATALLRAESRCTISESASTRSLLISICPA